MKNSRILSILVSIMLVLCSTDVFARCDVYIYGDTMKVMTKKNLNLISNGIEYISMLFLDSNEKLANGNLCHYDNNNNLRFEVECINGIANGTGKSYYSNGNTRFTVNYINGVPHGKAKYYKQNGELDKEFDYVRGEVSSARCADGREWPQAVIDLWHGTPEQRESIRNYCDR